MNRPRLVITGGDPLMREDIFELTKYAVDLGLHVSVTPAGTPRLTNLALGQLQSAGIHNLGLSLDGSNAKQHDALRRVRGSFEWTSRGAHAAIHRGIPVQINTMVTSETVEDIPRIYELLSHWGIMRWALFFLIPTGRGRTLSEISAPQSERFLKQISELSHYAPFQIKTTEAHHYRRVHYSRLFKAGARYESIRNTPFGKSFGIRDANGIVFVSHTGDVFPSGFLPVKGGNIRAKNLVEIYRSSSLFQQLRSVEELKGKCGRCEYRTICGGSRARAYAVTGDYMESDPLCVYQPRGSLKPLINSSLPNARADAA
jgi:radical SAM protein with 4Fe4S-binding SPASM domain